MPEQTPQPYSELASFGEELRREREIRGISLKEIADATKSASDFWKRSSETATERCRVAASLLCSLRMQDFATDPRASEDYDLHSTLHRTSRGCRFAEG
jgi:transcriptional regulator with XRE-family HTH domain